MMGRTILAAVFSLLLLCAGMGGIVLLYLWLISYVSMLQRRHRLRRQLDDNGKSPKQQGLSAADLQKLPTVECHEEGDERRSKVGGGGNDECAVCLEPFQIGDLCRVIPACSHAFHVQCADAWLSKCSVCPICRRSARQEEKGLDGGAAASLEEESGRDQGQESGRCPPPPPPLPPESIVVDMPIAIDPLAIPLENEFRPIETDCAEIHAFK